MTSIYEDEMAKVATDDRVSNVERQIARLTYATEALHGAIDEHTRRVQVVLLPDSPTAADVTGTPDRGDTSALTDRLAEIASSVERAVVRVGYVTGRIDL